MIESFCFRFYHLGTASISLWQAVFVSSCCLGLWNVGKLRGRVPSRSLPALAAVFLVGAGLRIGLSPRNMVETNFRGLERFCMLQRFQEAHSADMVRASTQYYVGYGQVEYWKLFVRDAAKTGIDDLFLIDGVTSTLNILLLFAAALLIFADVETALWAAAMFALSPTAIRLSFSDSVYSFGGTLTLLSLIHFMLFFETRAPAALFPALGFGCCALYTHVAFLAFPLAVPFFYPLRGRRWRDGGALLGRAGICLLVMFAALALPAYYVGTIPYLPIASEVHMGNPLDYAGRVLDFLVHRTNSFFNPDFNPVVVMALFLAGLGTLAAGARWVLAALISAIFIQTLPLPPAAVWLGPGGVNHFVNTGVVKQEHVILFYLLAAAHGLRHGADFLGRTAARRWVAAGAFLVLAAQPYLYRGFIGREYNYQRELSFLRRELPRHDLGEHVFTLSTGIPRMAVLRPGRFAIHTISRSASRKGNSEPPADHAPTLRFLDWMLSEGAAPVFYLSFDCYYRHPLDSYQGKIPAIRDDCGRFIAKYDLEPMALETFPSRAYNIEFDNSDAKEITLGFYRIRAKPGVKSGGRLLPCPGFEHVRREFYFKRAESMQAKGRRDEALKALGRVREIDLSQGDLGRVERMYRTLDEPRRALEVLDVMVRKQSADAETFVRRAELMMSVGRSDEALRTLERAETLHPGRPEVWRMLKMYDGLKKPGRALAMLDALPLGVAGDAGMQVERADLLLLMGRRDRALEALRRAGALFPGVSEMQRMPGLYSALKEPGLALGVLDALAERGIDNVGLQVQRSEFLLMMGRRDEALRALDRVRKLGPGEPEFRKMELLYHSLGNLGMALAALDGLAKLRPRDAGVQVGRGEVLTAMGRRSEALDALEKGEALGLSPDESRRAAWGYQSLDDCGRALRIWKRLVSGAEPRAKDYSDKAVCECRQGDWEVAVSDLQKAIELAPGRLEAHVSLAAVYASRGLNDKALEAYDRGLAIEPAAAEKRLRGQLVEGRDLILQRLGKPARPK